MAYSNIPTVLTYTSAHFGQLSLLKRF